MDEKDLAKKWEGTLGQSPEWKTLSAGVTYKPKTEEGLSTFSGGATLSQAQAQTLSGGKTLGGDGTAAAANVSAAGYRLLEEIGRGGMGVVYRARQANLARDVAVKLVLTDGDRAAQTRFVSEALVNGALDHPNIVPVHELGAMDGKTFLAMKLVGGRSWKDLLHPRTDEDCAAAAGYDIDKHLAILANVGNAVAFAHSRDIVHRDLKPENVMVGDFGEVLVMDWGIAVDIGKKPEAERRAQHKDTVRAPSGTPCYLPPELAEGRGADIGPWTDTYLLGAILYEILTGRPPHQGATLLAVLAAASRSEAPTFAADVPKGLAAICTKALSRDPANRYRTVAELQEALARFQKTRESERIAHTAREQLEKAEREASQGIGESSRAGAKTPRNRLYGEFAEAIAGFRQALLLWNENPDAKDGEREARLAYARAALNGFDLGLAEAQVSALAADDAEGTRLRGQIQAVREQEKRAKKSARAAKRALVGATVAIIAGLIGGFIMVRKEQARTAVERDSAIAAKEGEAESRKQADAAKVQAQERYANLLLAQASEQLQQDQDAVATLYLAGALGQSQVSHAQAAMMMTSALASIPEPTAMYDVQGLPSSCSRDGNSLLVMAFDQSGARTWDPFRGQPRSPVVSLGKGLNGSCAFMDDGRLIAILDPAEKSLGLFRADGSKVVSLMPTDSESGYYSLDSHWRQHDQRLECTGAEGCDWHTSADGKRIERKKAPEKGSGHVISYDGRIVFRFKPAWGSSAWVDPNSDEPNCWLVETGSERILWKGIESSLVAQASFTTDNQRVVAVFSDKSIRSFDLRTSAWSTISYQEERVDNLWVLPKNRVLILVAGHLKLLSADATGSDDGNGRGTPFRSPVVDVRSDASGNLFLVRDEEGGVVVLDSDLVPLTRPVLCANRIRYASLSPSGGKFVTATDDGLLTVWTLRKNRALTVQLPSESFHGSTLSPAGDVVFESGADGFSLVSLKDGKVVGEGRDGLVQWQGFSDDGRRLLVDCDRKEDGKSAEKTDDEGWTELWAIDPGPQARRIAKMPGKLFYFEHDRLVDQSGKTYDRDSGQVVTVSAGEDWQMQWTALKQVEDKETGYRFQIMQGGKPSGDPLTVSDARSQVMSPDRKLLYVATNARGVKVFRLPELRESPLRFAEGTLLNRLELSPTGDRVLTVTDKFVIQIWDAATGNAIGKPIASAPLVSFGDSKYLPTATSRDGRLFAVGGRLARVYDLSGGGPVTPPLSQASDLAFTADGGALALMDQDLNRVVVVPLTANEFTADAAMRSAQLVSGCKLGAGGIVERLSPAAMLEAFAAAGKEAAR